MFSIVFCFFFSMERRIGARHELSYPSIRKGILIWCAFIFIRRANVVQRLTDSTNEWMKNIKTMQVLSHVVCVFESVQVNEMHHQSANETDVHLCAQAHTLTMNTEFVS